LAGRKLGLVVISCNYNGWADAPEEEREGLDMFEAGAIEVSRASHVALPVQATVKSRALVRWYQAFRVFPKAA
jgi:hypothetical protein